MINLGVIGLRNIGKGHIRNALKLDGVKVVAGADTDKDRCQEAEKEFKLEYTATDAAEIFNDTNIDAVVLALPNHLHSPLSVKALEAGKHVLVEKPITGKSAEVAPMIEARDKSGKILMVGMNQRFTPVQYALREMLRQQTIGDVYLAKTFWNRRYPCEGLFERGAWGFKKEHSGGGPLLDLGIHKLDLLLFLLDFPEVESVTGFVTTGIGSVECAKRGIEYEVEDFGMGMIRLKNGSCIHLESSYFHNQHDMDVEDFFLSGTQGVIKGSEVSKIIKGEAEVIEYDPMENAPNSCVDHFCRVIRGEEELSSTCEQALTGLQIIEGIYESSKTGKPVCF
jgi:predicted dehydrogenase